LQIKNNKNEMAEIDLENKDNGSGEGQKKENPIVPELPEATESNIQTEELQKQVDQYKDLLLRKAAEFDNFKRRVENDTTNVIRYATESLVDDLLPVMDDFERSLKHSKENNENDALIKGVEMIYLKLSKVLESRGVKAFETVGKEFNVDYHDALMQMPRKDLPPHTVIEEVEKGYMLNDRVIRHAKVVVSSAAEEEQNGNGGTDISNDTSGK
jgi:molecular chaperone GrpE